MKTEHMTDRMSRAGSGKAPVKSREETPRSHAHGTDEMARKMSEAGSGKPLTREKSGAGRK
jgi:hypothetical protein